MQVTSGHATQLKQNAMMITYANQDGEIMKLYGHDQKQNGEVENYIIEPAEIDSIRYEGHNAGQQGDYTGESYYSHVIINKEKIEIDNFAKYSKKEEAFLPAETKQQDKEFILVEQGEKKIEFLEEIQNITKKKVTPINAWEMHKGWSIIKDSFLKRTP